VSQKIQDRADVQSRTVASLEERCASLKVTIDQLNLSLEQAATTDRDLRTEIKDLQRTLMDTSAHSQTAGEKLKNVKYFSLENLDKYQNIFYTASEESAEQ
jgi:rootletin